MSVKMKVKYPKIKFDSEKRVYVTFYLNNKRYRLFNGKKINCNLYPNSYPIQQRLEMGNLLAAEAYKFINSGLTFNHLINTNVNCNSFNDFFNNFFNPHLALILSFNKKTINPRIENEIINSQTFLLNIF